MFCDFYQQEVLLSMIPQKEIEVMHFRMLQLIRFQIVAQLFYDFLSIIVAYQRTE